MAARNTKSKGDRRVIDISDTLHYRLKQTALRKRLKLKELVDELLWEGLKADLQ